MPRIVDAEQRRKELTDAAARLIARSGIESATLRDVATEAGMTTGALTHYFADKRELLLHTFEASLAHRKSLRPTTDKQTAEQRLRASLEGALVLDEARRRHWMVTIVLCSQAPGDERLASSQSAQYREFRKYVAELVRASGFTAGRSATALAEQLIAAADGIAMQALFDSSTWPPSRQRKVFDEMFTTLTATNRLS